MIFMHHFPLQIIHTSWHIIARSESEIDGLSVLHHSFSISSHLNHMSSDYLLLISSLLWHVTPPLCYCFWSLKSFILKYFIAFCTLRTHFSSFLRIDFNKNVPTTVWIWLTYSFVDKDDMYCTGLLIHNTSLNSVKCHGFRRITHNLQALK